MSDSPDSNDPTAPAPGPAPSQGGRPTSPPSAPPPPPGPGYPPPPGPTQGYEYPPPSGPTPGDAWPGPGAGHVMSSRSRVVAGVLGLTLGGFGVHRFYLGDHGRGALMIVVTVLTCGIGSLWGFVEGILYLVGQEGWRTDAQGLPLRD